MISGLVLESPVGSAVNTRRFSPGATLRVKGSVTGALGISEPLANYTIQLVRVPEPIYISGRCNIIGNFEETFILPTVMAQARLQISDGLIWTTEGALDIPITIGDLPVEEVPSPVVAASIPNIVLTLGIAAIVIFGAAWYLKK
jgi:hypothetical protein